MTRRCSWCGGEPSPSSPILAAGTGGELPVHALCAAECLPRELDPHARAARRNVASVAVLMGLLAGTFWTADCERRWDAETAVTAPAVSPAPDAGDNLPAGAAIGPWPVVRPFGNAGMTTFTRGPVWCGDAADQPGCEKWSPAPRPLPGFRCAEYATTGPRVGRACVRFEGRDAEEDGR